MLYITNTGGFLHEVVSVWSLDRGVGGKMLAVLGFFYCFPLRIYLGSVNKLELLHCHKPDMTLAASNTTLSTNTLF